MRYLRRLNKNSTNESFFQVIFFTFTGNFKEPFVTKEITAGFKVVNYSFAVWFDWFEFVSLPLWLPGAVLAFFFRSFLRVTIGFRLEVKVCIKRNLLFSLGHKGISHNSASPLISRITTHMHTHITHRHTLTAHYIATDLHCKQANFRQDLAAVSHLWKVHFVDRRLLFNTDAWFLCCCGLNVVYYHVCHLNDVHKHQCTRVRGPLGPYVYLYELIYVWIDV